MTLEVGREVDRYLVDRLLGEGGMAAVYRVKHGRLGTWHALKVLTHTSRSVRERLILEGKVQATMRHPNVVAVSDVLEIDSQPALLMEYVDGPSLERLLGSYRPNPTEALALFRGVLDGVRHAHSRGLLHRDLKPANVLLQTAEGELVPKVADFGLAKLVDAESQTKTRTGTTMGTPAYMSPEQIRNAAGVDARADVFSLGCLLYELVTGGQRAFVQEDLISLYEATTQRRYAPVRDLVPDLDPRVEAAIADALAPTLDERLPTTDALWERLFAAGGPGAGLVLDPKGPLGECATALAVQARSGTGGADSATWATRAGAESPPTLNPPPLPEAPSQEVLSLRRRTRVAIGGALAAVLGAGFVVVLAGGVAVYAIVNRAEPVAAPVAVPAPVAAPVTTTTPAVAPPTAPEAPPVDPPRAAPAPANPPAAPSAVVRRVPPADAPAPTPKPAAEVPIATPPPPPVVEPDRAAATTARVRVEGDAKLVRLVSGALAVAPGSAVPPGTWEVRAVFDGPEVAAGRLTVVAGDDVTLKCVAQLAKCVARR